MLLYCYLPRLVFKFIYITFSDLVLPSDIRDRLRELEYGLSLRDAFFPAPEIPGHLQYLAPDAWARVDEVKATLTEVEILLGAAAYCLFTTTGAPRPSTFSDRDFALELASLARFYSSFKVSGEFFKYWFEFQHCNSTVRYYFLC